MALRPADRTLSSLTGILVTAAVLWLILNFVYAPSCGRFACSYVPSWWPQASADTGDGTQHKITSGHENISDRIEELLRSSGKVTMPPVGAHPAITHVETKVAMTMRETNVTTVVMVINNEKGPCPGPYSCQAVLGVVLPAGYTLTVWWPGRAKPETFTGQE